MGIQGLIPFVKRHHASVNLTKYKDMLVAVDGYVWLHRGAFSCALDLLTKKEETTKWVYQFYCIIMTSKIR